MPDFEMKNICKSFPGVKALDNACFEANKGDITALLGENGAGKSTLIKTLCGEYKPDSGEIYLEGEKIEITNTRNAIEQKICAVYQELSLVSELTIAENLFLGFYDVDKMNRVSYKQIEQDTIKLFEKYGVDKLNPKTKVKELSLSQKQVLEILKALNRDGDIIIFDEATSALSEKMVKWLMNIIRRLASEKKIIIFISHRLDEIQELCTKVVVYRGGTDVASLPMKEAKSDQLVSLMLGREIGGYYPVKEDFAKEEVLVSMKNVNSGHKLKKINLDIQAGEILGVGGLAGQGQSELFKCLFGMFPYSGEITIKGRTLRLKSAAAAMKEGIALIPEERGLQGVVLKQNIRENITLACLDKVCTGLFLSREKEKKIVNRGIRRLSIKAESPETIVGTLSGGNQQKVVLAKELATEPDIILMYDITRGVDVGTKKEMFNMTKQYAKEGKAILFYSTDSEELMNVCNSVIIMNNGTIAGRLDRELVSRENIIRISVGEEAI
ncbi:sugar ABC transporter ATP-binding protein [Clostridium sp. C105KSO13]|uniref:sugar ABC transporter ATP-binding protein n=1 Tax=Clostridium sp. C105KSO13 TaxID=1776045 RepID=UPI0007406670|nr:sugar ABC transporter ATP-binding protein [Clostridium sp. C105KSO13]CUX17617.1 Xylose import ATP-binding protein XylG [Clostridium sp. C105KSO13]